MKKQNFLLILLCIVISIGALFLAPKESEFGGSDGQAEATITEIKEDYEPWFTSIYEPASGEIESLLFTLQGSIGVGIICYVIGLNKGKQLTKGKVL